MAAARSAGPSSAVESPGDSPSAGWAIAAAAGKDRGRARTAASEGKDSLVIGRAIAPAAGKDSTADNTDRPRPRDGPVAGGGIVVRPKNGSHAGGWLWQQPAINNPTRIITVGHFMGPIG